MRIIISVIICLYTLSINAQRVEFNDPDLTFSFVKPKEWSLFDDGYRVLVSPSVKDSSNIYFSITYFEKPQPQELGLEEDLIIEEEFEQELVNVNFKIAKVEAQTYMQADAQGEKKVYIFEKFNHRFYIYTAENDSKNSFDGVFKRILKSIRVTAN